jgi:hypothetical protein
VIPPDYVMGYHAPLDPHRVEDFFNGKLSSQELVTFAQDVIESGEAMLRGPNVHRLCWHMLDMNLCTLPGRPH